MTTNTKGSAEQFFLCGATIPQTNDDEMFFSRRNSRVDDGIVLAGECPIGPVNRFTCQQRDPDAKK